ncbi:MAG: hypothetical protein EKK37_05195 [Sphingobacteriales bacterium]|nr:MAG: hypothetical protein EKK37_05195 [Sphingobacteriales bacterium]
MNTTNILLVGNNEEQSNNWIKLLNDRNEWKAEHALTDEEAIEKFHQYHFDVVVLGNDLSADAVKKLNKLCTFQHEDVIVINNTADLAEKISEALKAQKRNNTTFSFVDDALKSAGLNINIQ